MMNFFKRLPIRTQLLILAVATTFVMIFIIFLTYYQISKSITKKNSEYTIDIITQVKQSVSVNCDIINRIITNIAYNPTIQDYLMETDEVAKLELLKKVDKLLINMAGIKDGILDILVIGDNGNYDSLTGKTSFVNEMKNFPQRAKAYYSGIKVFENDNYKRYCFIVGTMIYSADPQKMPGNKIGALAMIIDIKAISPEIAILSKTSATKFYLLDRNDKVFSSNEALELGRKFDVIKDSTEDLRKPVVSLIKGKKNIVLKEELMDIGGKVISIVPEKELFSDLLEIRRIVISIFIITIVLLSIPFMFIINNILQPLKKLMSFMNKIKSGNLKNRIHLEGYAEMSIMAQEFNSMLDEIDSLTHRLIDTNSKLYQSELGKKQSELAFLQSQINPHFLYNTLESIKSIATVRGVVEIKDIAKALGRIFRYSIKGADIVSLLFGGPSFIQHGRDNTDAVDGYVYAVSGDQWDNGSEMRIGRVPKEHILDVNRWEWAIPQENGSVNWTSDLGNSEPVLTLERHLSLPEMIYLPNLRRYILLTWALHKDFSTEAGSELTILEAEQPWGPFRLVYYEEIWDNIEVCPYCPRIPLKWFDMNSMSGWIVHSGNWNCPNLDPWYRPHVRSFEFMY